MGRVGSQKGISPLLLDDSDPNPKVDHRGVSERTTEIEGVGVGGQSVREYSRLKEARKAKQGQKEEAGPSCTVSLKPTCCDVNPMSLSYVALFGNRVVEGFN